MPDTFKRENDLRVVKTRRALYDALTALLRRSHFSKITVYDICARALVSRTAFYAHFKDKYDLLEHMLQPLRERLVDLFFKEDDKALEDYVCTKYTRYAGLVANVLEDTSMDMFLVLFHFFAPPSEAFRNSPGTRLMVQSYVAGGIYSALLLQTRRHGREDAELRERIACACRLIRTHQDFIV